MMNGQALLAHAGPHDLTTANGVVHALTSPDHLLTAAVIIATGYAAYGLYRSWVSRSRRTGEGSTPSPSGRGRG
jgi:hypothetical protein